VYDLKAVNPNVKAVTDTRTVQEIIDNINRQGGIVVRAMANLRGMIEV
jgi:type I restriction enzyme M protein